MFSSSPFYWQMEKSFAENKGLRTITEEVEGGIVKGKAL